MIVSYHPCYEGDINRLCAGRDPDHSDIELIRKADAVILPQGCYRSLFNVTKKYAKRFFPDYTARFSFPGKIGQTRLFAKTKTPHPETLVFHDTNDFFRRYESERKFPCSGYPFVFKFDWSDEGSNIFLVQNPSELKKILSLARRYEKTDQKGFLLQKYIRSANRTLRVVIIGKRILSYWRVQPDPSRFCANLSRGGIIDTDSEPALQEKAKRAVSLFSEKTNINLAGIDIIFDRDDPGQTPLFLEINYYFGRKGLGGSAKYYAILKQEIDRWIMKQGLDLPGVASV